METIEQHCTLNKQQIAAVKTLVEECAGKDKGPAKIYWSLLGNVRDNPSQLLIWQGNQLISYLGYFLFRDDCAEVCALVHPEHRLQGHFTHLLDCAKTQLIDFDIHQVKFPVGKDSVAGKLCLQKLGAQYTHTEVTMLRHSNKHEPVPKASHRLFLRSASTDEDINSLAKISMLCFNADYTLMQQRYKGNLLDQNRKTWLIYLDKQCIGKIHVRFDENEAYIHDIAIIPVQQKKGYASRALRMAINTLIDLGHHVLKLEVQQTNQRALSLYTGCAFKLRQAYDYWSLTFK